MVRNCLFMVANAAGMLLLTGLSGMLIHFGGVVQGRPQIDGRPNIATIVYCGRTAIATCAVLTVLYLTVIMNGLIESAIGSGALTTLTVIEELALWASIISSWLGLRHIRNSFDIATA